MEAGKIAFSANQSQGEVISEKEPSRYKVAVPNMAITKNLGSIPQCSPKKDSRIIGIKVPDKRVIKA